MKATTIGWLAFGLSDGTPAHQLADMVQGSVTGATCTLRDAWSTSKSTPSADGSQDVTAGACSESGGVTTMTFTRPLKSPDTLTDLEIVNRNMLVQWAYSASDTFTQVHTSTGTVNINFIADLMPGAPTLAPASTPAPTPAPPPPSVMSNSFSANNGAMNVSWTMKTASLIEFTVRAKTLGYVAIGWTLFV